MVQLALDATQARWACVILPQPPVQSGGWEPQRVSMRSQTSVQVGSLEAPPPAPPPTPLGSMGPQAMNNNGLSNAIRVCMPEDAGRQPL